MNQKIKNNELILGSWINTASPIVAEIMAGCDFDFLCIDTEHSCADFFQTQQIIQAINAENKKCLPIVRLPGNDYATTKKYLDLGAKGVIAPLITKKEEAEYLVSSVKYPPLGNRGVGYGRSHGYGYRFNEYMTSANDETFVCVQIEHKNALDNLDEIFSVPGVDAMIIGPYDLSASMGITAEFDHPKYIEAYKTILDKAIKHNIVPGIHVVQPDPDQVIKRWNEGFRFIAYSLDITVLGTYFKQGINSITEGIK